MTRGLWRTYPVLLVLFTWVVSASLFPPEDGPGLAFIPHLLFALLAAWWFCLFEVESARDRRWQIALVIGGLLNAAMGVLLFVIAAQDVSPHHAPEARSGTPTPETRP